MNKIAVNTCVHVFVWMCFQLFGGVSTKEHGRWIIWEEYV